MNTMTYKDYEAVAEYDGDAGLSHREVLNLRDVITFQGQSAAGLKQAFADSAEDYLAFCKERERNQTSPIPASSSYESSRRSTELWPAPPSGQGSASINGWPRRWNVQRRGESSDITLSCRHVILRRSCRVGP